MHHSSRFSCCRLVRTLLSLAVCALSFLGQASNGKDAGPAGSLLGWEAVKQKIDIVSKIQVTGCTAGDLTINGLARLANKHLEKAGRSERVFLEAAEDMTVEETLKTNFFSPLYESKDSLDKEDLVKQINAGSLNDLLMNLPRLLNLSMRWFEGGFVCTDSSPSIDPVLMHKYTPNLYEIRAVKVRPRQ